MGLGVTALVVITVSQKLITMDAKVYVTSQLSVQQMKCLVQIMMIMVATWVNIVIQALMRQLDVPIHVHALETPQSVMIPTV